MTCHITDCLFIVPGKTDCAIRVDKDSKVNITRCQIYSSASSYPFFKKLQTLWTVAKFIFKKEAP